MSKKNKTKFKRRSFLLGGGSGLLAQGTSVGQTLVHSLVLGLVNKAQAQSVTVNPRNYVFLGMPGGPPRWFFDGPLDPFNSGNYMSNPHVGTRFANNGGRAGDVVHETTPITQNGVTLHMPYLWRNTIPTSSGAEVPMGRLMSNMLMMRGISMEADGHDNNYRKQMRPLNSSPSLDGQVADRSTRSVPAVLLGPNVPQDSYLSAKGIGAKNVGQFYDPLSRVLEPFMQGNDNPNSAFQSRRIAMENAISQALTQLGAYAQSNNPGAENLFSLRNSAETLLRSSFGNLEVEYNQRYNKYNNLIIACRQKAINQQILGVTDLPIGPGDFTNITRQAQINDGQFVYNNDYRSLISANSSINYLAESLAVAEFLLVRGYSSSIVCGFGGVSNFLVDQLRSAGNPNGVATGSNMVWDMDEHFGGSHLSIIANGFMFLAIAACLNEFIETLKANNLFNETVIQLGSEMSRLPRADQSGSDHGWAGNAISVFSGAVDRPLVLGNCYVDARNHSTIGQDQNRGSWGIGAPTLVDGVEQLLTIGHATSTVAHLLRVQPILPNNGSLVRETGNTLTQMVENGRNV